jgi:hypothetical protein
VTTIDAAAANKFGKPIALAVMAAFLSFALAGCESSNNLFGSSGDPAQTVADQAQQAPVGQVAKMAVAPLLGPPDNVNKMFQSQVGAALEKQRITVAKAPADKSEYTLRGYVVSTSEKAKTKVSYVWHVTDVSGKQVHSFTGEELLAAPQGKDPWPAITPQVVDAIAAKTSASIAGWLQAQPAGPAVAQAPAQGAAALSQNAAAPQQKQTAAAQGVTAQGTATQGAATQGAAAAAGGAQQAQAGGAQQAQAGTAQQAGAAQGAATGTTGSIGRDGDVNVVVAGVTGAPGDGSVALTNAMQRALSGKGVQLTDKAGGQTYKVQGKVAVGQPKDGKQPIQIDWELTDPQGKFFKRVTQKNEVPQGMLDGAWGQTADAAAGAAAETISGLLPKQKQALNAPAQKPN